MQIVYYSIFGLCVAYVIYVFATQARTNLKREKAIEEMRKKWEDAVVDEQKTKDIIHGLIKSTYGDPTLHLIEKNQFKEGMSDYLVKMAVGIPNEVQSAAFKSSSTERWHYDALIFTFQNGKLIGWEKNKNPMAKK